MIRVTKRHIESKTGTGYWDRTDLPEEYCGKTYVTSNGSEYRISSNGRIFGRESIEGAKVKMVAGLPKEMQLFAKSCLDTRVPKSRLESMIEEFGTEPKKGQALVILITDRATEQMDRYGLVIPCLKRIK